MRVANLYKKRPSEILAIDDEYTAFCLDETVSWIQQEMESGKKPKFRTIERNKATHYKSFSDFYAQYN